VLVPNLNGAFTDTHGAGPENRNRLADQRGQQLIDAHLKRLAIASHGGPNPFSQPLNGRLNWHQLALVGHSMGGGAAALSALNRQDQTSPKQIQQGLGAVAALVLVSPTRSHPLGDVLGLMLLGANHNFFNTAIDYDDYYRWPNHASLCDPQRSDQRLSRVIQEQWLQHFLVEFLTMVLPDQGSSGRSGLGLAPDRPAPDRIYDQPVLTNLVWPSRRRYTLFRAGDEASVYQPSPNLQVIPCGAFRPCDGRERSPAFPTVLRLRWRQSDQELVFPLPPKDFRDFSSLQLRLAGVEELPPSSTSAPLGIVLRDRHGGAIRLDLPPTTTALSPLMRDPDTSPFTYPSALRIPLAQFRGVDLATLSSLELRFDGMPQGSLDLAGIEFLSRAEGEW
jgi:pimeloyl-ACP methyl ester carboxylesterase